MGLGGAQRDRTMNILTGTQQPTADHLHRQQYRHSAQKPDPAPADIAQHDMQRPRTLKPCQDGATKGSGKDQDKGDDDDLYSPQKTMGWLAGRITGVSTRVPNLIHL